MYCLIESLIEDCPFIANNTKCLLTIFLTQAQIIDFVIWIIKLCDLLDYLTSCSIDLCFGFAIIVLVVIIQITKLFILDFHPNLKGATVQASSISFCSQSVAAESKYQFYLYYDKFTDFCNMNN